MNWLSSILILAGYCLTGARKPQGFLVSACGSIAGSIYFYLMRDWPVFGLNVIFTVVSGISWFNWRRNVRPKKV